MGVSKVLVCCMCTKTVKSLDKWDTCQRSKYVFGTCGYDYKCRCGPDASLAFQTIHLLLFNMWLIHLSSLYLMDFMTFNKSFVTVDFQGNWVHLINRWLFKDLLLTTCSSLKGSIEDVRPWQMLIPCMVVCYDQNVVNILLVINVDTFCSWLCYIKKSFYIAIKY